jgi:hypothetical protein
MNNQQITNRLNDLRAYGLTLMDKDFPEFRKLEKTERKVSEIVHAVRNGVSALSRLKTADKMLTKAGF